LEDAASKFQSIRIPEFGRPEVAKHTSDRQLLDDAVSRRIFFFCCWLAALMLTEMYEYYKRSLSVSEESSRTNATSGEQQATETHHEDAGRAVQAPSRHLGGKKPWKVR